MKNWSYYLFSDKNKKYIFETFSCSIKEIPDLLYSKLQIHNEECNTIINQIERRFPDNYHNFPRFKNKKCFITLDFSNICNMNCSYCFRTKKKFSNPNNIDFKEILDYITNVFMPDAEEYSFSVGYTTEVSFNTEYIRKLDAAIIDYEGHLFTNESFITSPSELYNALPVNLQKKYPIKLNPLESLNNIIKNEKIEDYFEYDKFEAAKKILDSKNPLSAARRVIINRNILSKTFPSIVKEAKPKIMSISFMTNGTHITDDFISLIKEEGMDNIYVSIDGPENIHNYSRKFNNGKGTFYDVINGINKIKNAGIKVIASTVINSKYPDIDNIVEFLDSLNLDGVEFCFIRGKNNSDCFTSDTIQMFFKSFDILLNKILKKIEQDDYHLLKLLKNNYVFSYLKSIIEKNFNIRRCSFDDHLVISPEGDLFHCNYTMGMDDDLMGNIKSMKYPNIKNIEVDSFKRCKECWAKFLCGGICYYEKLLNNNRTIDLDCYVHKEYIKRALTFYVRCFEMQKLDKVHYYLSLNY